MKVSTFLTILGGVLLVLVLIITLMRHKVGSVEAAVPEGTVQQLRLEGTSNVNPQKTVDGELVQ